MINKEERKNKAVFLDRDGTLNYDEGYTYKTMDFKLLPDVIPSLKLLGKKFILIIITNQSGVGRGSYTMEDVRKFNELMLGEFEKRGIKIADIFICPHHPDDKCGCRKPGTRFIKEAEKKYNIDLECSYVIGDHPWDIEMGIRAGCMTIYVLTGHGMIHIDELSEKDIQPTLITNNLYDSALWIVENDK